MERTSSASLALPAIRTTPACADISSARRPASVNGYDSVPYLLRAARATVTTVAQVHRALCVPAVMADPVVADAIRDIALSLNCIDKALCDFIAQALSFARFPVPVDTAHSLDGPRGLIAQLQSASLSDRWKPRAAPAGGTASLLYHFAGVLDAVSIQLGSLCEGTLLRMWRSLSLERPLALLYMALEPSPGAHLRSLGETLSILLRLWMIAADTYQKSNVNGDRSYALLIAALSEEDYDPGSQPMRRRLLEASTLPKGAVLWGSTGSMGILKRLLNVFYAGMHVGHGYGAVVGLPLSAAGLLYYAARPQSAAERTRVLLTDPDIAYIKHLWLMLDSPVAVHACRWLLMPRLPLDEDATVAGVRTRVFGNYAGPWEKPAASTFASAAAAAAAPGSPASSPSGVVRSEPSEAVGGGPASCEGGSRSPAASAAALVFTTATTLSGIVPPSLLIPIDVSAHIVRRLGGGGSGSGSRGSSVPVSASPSRVGLPWGYYTEEEDEEEGQGEAHRDGSGRSGPHPEEGNRAPSWGTGVGPLGPRDDSGDTGATTTLASGHHAVRPGARSRAGLLLPTASPLSSPLLIGTVPPVLLWIHGGGFVGSSFSTDSVFLGRWVAASAAAPPFLICFPHYSLAPKARYPTALNELMGVYRYFRERSPRVVVGGDSAGGNLASALTLRCIAEGVPPPSGLLLVYPALNLNNSPSPARALHLSDPLVPISLLQRLAQSYIGDDYAKPAGNTQRFIHPLLASDDELAQFPPTYIMSGGLDPLLDDAVDFNMRLRRQGIEGELLIFRTLTHGFLNFGWATGVSDAVATLQEWFLLLMKGA